MNRIFHLIVFIGVLSVSVQCQHPRSVTDPSYAVMLNALLDGQVKEVSVQEATTKYPNATYLDAREKAEYKVSHIKNAKYIGYNSLDLSAVAGLDKQQTLIVYCSVGYRSEKITQKLTKAGFTDVRNLYGGIFEWKNQGHPVYQNTLETDRVHAYDRSWGIWLNKGIKVY